MTVRSILFRFGRRIAAGAACALLFSALSPAFAAALQARTGPDFGELCTVQGHGNSASGEAPLQSGAVHAIHCAWCLSPASQAALPGSAVPPFQSQAFVHESPFLPETVAAHAARHTAYFSQGPPASV